MITRICTFAIVLLQVTANPLAVQLLADDKPVCKFLPGTFASTLKERNTVPIRETALGPMIVAIEQSAGVVLEELPNLPWRRAFANLRDGEADMILLSTPYLEPDTRSSLRADYILGSRPYAS